MTYTGLESFVEDLKHLVYSNDNPFINHPLILSQRPQMKLLYEELGSLIQTLFVDQEHDLHEPEQVRNLKKRFKDAAEEAQHMVDLFVSAVNLRNNEYFSMPEAFKRSLDLEDVRRSLRSIKVELTRNRSDNKLDSSHGSNRLKMECSAAVAGTSGARNRFGNKKVLEEIVVGFDRDVEVIRDKLVEDQKQLDVASIIGMGGLGKTTVARKVFNDPFIVYHFHVRAWATVPLAVVVIAGVVAKEAPSKESWERVAHSVSSCIVSDRNGHAETLALSYDHLPRHLKDCFLYLGGFPEDYKFEVQKLIWLWMAEGFVQEAGNQSLEEIAEDYLMDLIDRNLAIVAGRKSNGGIKAFSVHDLLREFCLAKTTGELLPANKSFTFFRG